MSNNKTHNSFDKNELNQNHKNKSNAIPHID